MFSFIDRMGWNEVFEEGSFDPRSGILLRTDAEGNTVVFDPYQPPPDDFSPQEDFAYSAPSGMDNILGSGIFG